MESNPSLADKKLNGMVTISKCVQYTLMVVLAGIIATRQNVPIEGYNYKEMAMYLSLMGVLLSFMIDKMYVNARKEAQKLKIFSPDEEQGRQVEYFARFRFSYFMWGILSVLFFLMK